MKVLFIVPYPIGQAPSQRFRFEQYFKLLKTNNIKYETRSFLDEKTWSILYQNGFHLQKIFGILKGLTSRFFTLFTLYKFEYIFIHREATPIGPPLFEWLTSKILRKKIIYDFDDAIWLPNTSNENRIIQKVKYHSKVRLICKWSYKISCGNNFLCAFAKQYNSNVILNPSTIDTEGLHNPDKIIKPDHKKLTIGWTGSHSTMKYLNEILPALKKIESKYDVEILVISNKPPNFKLKSLKFIRWSKDSEITDLIKLDIGLMPLIKDEWSNGKCGFKLLQYMALKIPAVASPVGVNQQIINHNINGFLCSNISEWVETMKSLISDSVLRQKVGLEGRKTVESHFSIVSNSNNFLSLFS